jgi:hypothetical protein
MADAIYVPCTGRSSEQSKSANTLASDGGR